VHWRTVFSRKSGGLATAFQRPDCHLHVVVHRSRTTILPPTPRPTGRLGGSICRCSERRVEAYNDRSFDSNIDSNNDADDDGFNFRDNVASNARFSDGLRLRFRLRLSAGFGYRRSCRCSSLPSERYFGRYFPTNNERYFDGLSRGFAARFQLPGTSVQFGGLGTRLPAKTGDSPTERLRRTQRGTVPIFAVMSPPAGLVGECGVLAGLRTG